MAQNYLDAEVTGERKVGCLEPLAAGGELTLTASGGRSIANEEGHSDDRSTPPAAIGTWMLDENCSASADVRVPDLVSQQSDALLPYGRRD